MTIPRTLFFYYLHSKTRVTPHALLSETATRRRPCIKNNVTGTPYTPRVYGGIEERTGG